MIGVSHIGIAASRGGAPAPPNPDFVFIVDTTQAGSASDTIVLPLLSGGTYTNLTVDWGDGSSGVLNNSNKTHTYATGGVYTITVSGDVMKRFRFANTGDKSKLIQITNWGLFDTGGVNQSFYGCNNLTSVPSNSPTLSGVVDANLMYALCTSLNCNITFDSTILTQLRDTFSGATSFNGQITLNTPNVTDVASFLQNTTSLNNSSVSNFDTSNWTNLNSFFLNSGVDQSLATWDITSMTSAANFLLGGQLSTANYDATLVGWEATLQAAYPSGAGYTPVININFGSSQYTLGGAADAARASLISTFGWTITDGGGI